VAEQGLPAYDNDMLRAVLDALREHVAVLDADGTIIYTNAAWRQFASENGAVKEVVDVGASYLGVCAAAVGEASDGASEAGRGIREVLEGRRDAFEFEYPCHSPTEKRWFLLYVTPLRLNGTGAVTSHINVTSRKLAEIELTAMQEALIASERSSVLVETAGAAAHEMNQPLTVTLGRAQMLAAANVDGQHAEACQDIVSACGRMTQILSRMREVKSYRTKSYVRGVDIVDFDGPERNADENNE
jgi:nitrogen-specific signal transduction histidine kinase